MIKPTSMVTGKWATRQVFIDGVELLPARSQKLCNHSPDGFNWSYGGSGPSQLALALALELLPAERDAMCSYQQLKSDVVARLPASDFELKVQTLLDWVRSLQVIAC